MIPIRCRCWSVLPTLALLAFPLSGECAQAEGTLNALDLLHKVADAYAKLDSYEWTARSIWRFDNGVRKEQSPGFTLIIAAFRRPGQMRLEVRPLSAGPFAGTSITNGTTVWDYRPYLQVCCHPDLTPFPPYVAAALGSSLPYERITEKLKWATFAGISTLTVDRQSIRCLLVDALYEPETRHFTVPVGSEWTQSAVTYWIDPKTNLVMQQHHHEIRKSTVSGRINAPYHSYRTVSLVNFRVNPQLPDSLFNFKIPKDVRETKHCPSSGGG